MTHTYLTFTLTVGMQLWIGVGVELFTRPFAFLVHPFRKGLGTKLDFHHIL